MTSHVFKAVLTLFFITSQICTAQIEGKVNLRFVSFPKTNRPIPIELLVGEKETIIVQTPSNELSPVYKVDSMENWVVGKTTTGENGITSFAVYGQSKAIKSSEQLILIIRQGSDFSDGLTLTAIDYSPNGLDKGDFMFINASDLDIEGIVGEKKIAIKPGESSQITPAPSDKDASRKSFRTQLFYKKDNHPKPFFSTTWPLNPRARSMIFFYNSPHNNNGLKMHTIQDFTP